MSLSPMSRTEVRKKTYKVAFDADKARRKRKDNMGEFRKSKREESLQKKRREGMQAQQFAPTVQSSAVENKLESLPAMVAGVWSDEPNLQLEATTQFRKLLSIERSPPIKEVIDAGVVPRFLGFLRRHDFPQLQFEAAWALTNIALGTSEHTRYAIANGAVPQFIQLLGSPSDDVCEQAALGLGSLARDSTKCRDLVLGQGALNRLLPLLTEHTKISMLRIATCTLSILCRGKPQLAFDQTNIALRALERLIHLNDEQVLTDACWALSHLSDGTTTKKAVIEAGVFLKLVELLVHGSTSVRYFARQTVGNILTTGVDVQTLLQQSPPAMSAAIWSDVPYLQHKATSLYRRFLSVEHVISAQVVPRLVQFLSMDGSQQLQIEAALALIKIASGTSEQKQVVIECGAVSIFIELLRSPSNHIREKAAIALGMLACESPECRDRVLKLGVLNPLLDQLNEHTTRPMLRIVTWTLYILCSGKPQPAFDKIKPALGALGHLIDSNDQRVLTYALWALCCMSDGTNDTIQAVFKAGVLRRLVELLLHQYPFVRILALRTVRNILNGVDEQTLLEFSAMVERVWADD